MERFHSSGTQLCELIATKESVYIRKEFNSHRIGLGHQYGRRDVMCVERVYKYVTQECSKCHIYAFLPRVHCTGM